MHLGHLFVCTDLYIVIHNPTGVCKVWMFGVDVGQLNCNQVMDL